MAKSTVYGNVNASLSACNRFNRQNNRTPEMSYSTAICQVQLVNHKPFVVDAEIESVHVTVNGWHTNVPNTGHARVSPKAKPDKLTYISIFTLRLLFEYCFVA